MRSILLERGIVVALGRRSLLQALSTVDDDADRSGLSPRVKTLLGDMRDQWRAIDAQIAALDEEFAEMARNNPDARRLATIPGVGVMNATALVAAVGDGRSFSRGRDLAAWIGLVRAKRRLAGSPSCWASRSAEASICANSSSREHVQCFPPLRKHRRRLARGCAVCLQERTATRWS